MAPDDPAWSKPRLVTTLRVTEDTLMRLVFPIAAVQRAQFRLVDITANPRAEVLPLARSSAK